MIKVKRGRMKKVIYKKYRNWFDLVLKLNIPYFSSYIQNKIYDKSFFDDANELKKKSSKKVAEIIDSFFQFKSVLDIGCGCGIYIEEFKKLGKDVLGCDSSIDAIRIASKDFTLFYCDVSKPIYLNRKFDLVMCFEVAEHIRKKHSSQLVKSCTQYSDTVIFTAAPPGQGGIGHINEQPYDFWKHLFKKNQFQYNHEFSERVKTVMKKQNVVNWIANNFMVFRKKPKT